MSKVINRYIVITFFGVALILLIEYLGFFGGLNNYLYDLSFRIRGPRQHSERIIIAAIDEKTLQKLGRWPIRRSYYGRFLDKVSMAAVVGFDIIMAEPSEDDPMLADAIRRHSMVILPVYFDSNLNPVYPAGTFAPRSVGHIHVEPDIDGVVRKVFHTIHEGDRVISSFASAIYETVTDNKTSLQNARGREVDPLRNENLLQTDAMHINYSGPAGTFQTISFADILEDKYPSNFFKDKIVLVGLTAIGLEDRILTPFSQQRNRMSGVEGHANILNNLFQKNNIKEAPLWITLLAAFAISLSAFFVFMKLTEKQANILWLCCLISVIIIIYLLFSAWNLWLNPALFCFASTFIYGTTYLVRLDDAARRLHREYAEVAAQLHWHKAGTVISEKEKGLVGFLSAGGINAKIQILTEMIGQLIFEKKLIDTALLNDIHGIMLFNPAGILTVDNERARAIFHALSIRTDNLDEFYKGLSPHIVKDETEGDSQAQDILFGAGIASMLFFSAPEHRYLKMDTSVIPFNEQKYHLCVFTDVTKIKELELMKGQIVSTVSHELKQPLTVIRGFCELLDENLKGEDRIYTEVINKEVLKMLQFINRFLDISRLESAGDHIRKEPVNMVELIHQAEPHFKALADEKCMRVRVEMPDSVSTVVLDRDITRQCIMNLVENAIKYSPPGQDVIIKLTEANGGVRIGVIDNGCGIEECELGKIFDKFYRGKAALSNGSRGSGLGLAFVKEAIENQGGTISVSSMPGAGSTFSIGFPAG